MLDHRFCRKSSISTAELSRRDLPATPSAQQSELTEIGDEWLPAPTTTIANYYNCTECGAKLDSIPGLCRGFSSARTGSFRAATRIFLGSGIVLFQSTMQFAPRRIEERSPLQRLRDDTKFESLWSFFRLRGATVVKA
jgi:hypothetical protein